jgi:hypothetical protein
MQTAQKGLECEPALAERDEEAKDSRGDLSRVRYSRDLICRDERLIGSNLQRLVSDSRKVGYEE